MERSNGSLPSSGSDCGGSWNECCLGWTGLRGSQAAEVDDDFVEDDAGIKRVNGEDMPARAGDEMLRGANGRAAQDVGAPILAELGGIDIDDLWGLAVYAGGVAQGHAGIQGMRGDA